MGLSRAQYVQPSETSYELAVLISNAAEAATTAFGAFTATRNATATILAGVSAAATLSLTGLGQTNNLNSGALTAGEWYTFQFPLVASQSYSFEVSAACNVALAVLY